MCSLEIREELFMAKEISFWKSLESDYVIFIVLVIITRFRKKEFHLAFLNEINIGVFNFSFEKDSVARSKSILLQR